MRSLQHLVADLQDSFWAILTQLARPINWLRWRGKRMLTTPSLSLQVFCDWRLRRRQAPRCTPRLPAAVFNLQQLETRAAPVAIAATAAAAPYAPPLQGATPALVMQQPSSSGSDRISLNFSAVQVDGSLAGPSPVGDASVASQGESPTAEQHSFATDSVAAPEAKTPLGKPGSHAALGSSAAAASGWGSGSGAPLSQVGAIHATLPAAAASNSGGNSAEAAQLNHTFLLQGATGTSNTGHTGSMAATPAAALLPSAGTPTAGHVPVMPSAQGTAYTAPAATTAGPASVSTSDVAGQGIVHTASTTQGLSTTAVTSSVSGSVTTFTATVAPQAGNSGTPTGTVRFYYGQTYYGSFALNSQDQASLDISGITGNSYTVTAIYSGDSSFVSSTGGISQVIGVNATSVTLTSSTQGQPSTANQTVTLTATLNLSGSGSPAPTNTIGFYDGQTALGKGSLSLVGSQYQATWTMTSLTGAIHNFTAIYGGDSSYVASSNSMLQTVVQASTITSLQAPAASSQPGKQVTLTALVRPSPAGNIAPTRSVTFYDGSNTLGNNAVSLVNGQYQAVLTVPSLAAGQHTLTASYAGDLYFSSSQGSTVLNVANPANGVAAPACNCGCPNQPGALLQPPTQKSAPAPSNSSGQPVRYYDGVVTIAQTDLQSEGFGFPWGQTRSWSNGPATPPAATTATAGSTRRRRVCSRPTARPATRSSWSATAPPPATTTWSAASTRAASTTARS